MATNAAKQRYFKLLSLAQAGQLAQAEEGLSQALRASPKDPNLLHLSAQVHEGLGRKDRAIDLYRHALEAHPGWLEAQFNLARLLNLKEDDASKQESFALLETLSRSHPEKAEVWEALARFEQVAGKLPDAARHWREALQRQPYNPGGLGQYYLCLRSLCDWRVRPEPHPDLAPQILTALFDDPDLQKRSAQLICARRFSAIHPLPRAMAWEHKRLRVGYLSSDFHAHATARLIAELFSLHDKEHFEIFAYSYGPDDGSPMRERLKQTAEHFIDLNALTPQACAERIRADEIDLLIDLKGHTHGGHLDILAYRPGRVQLHWLGFPGTTGASFIDYFVGDAVTIPVRSETFFAEKVARMPYAYQINDRQRRAAAPQTKAAYGLPDNAVVLASFNQSYKITPELFDVWCRILKAAPQAVLWLLESNPFIAENLRREAETRGIDPVRLFFAKPLPQAEHLARYHVVDLALDTYPVGGHTTTSDALWLGAPVITLSGQSFVSRVAGSLLRACELPSLVTASFEEYEKRVLDLVHNKAARDSIRQHLTTKRDTLPLFDTPRFVKAWEALLTSCLDPIKTS